MSTSWDDVTRFWDAATAGNLYIPPIWGRSADPATRSVTAFQRVSAARRSGFWELSRFRECRRTYPPIGPHGYPLGIEFSPDGRFIVERYEFGLVRFWTWRRLPRWRVFNSKPSPRFSSTPGATSITRWTGTDYGAGRFVRLRTPSALALRFRSDRGTNDRMSWLAIDRDGHRLGVAADQAWRVLDLDATVRSGARRTPGIHHIALSPDLRWAATATHYGTPSTECGTWRLARRPPGGDAPILRSRFRVDGKWLVNQHGATNTGLATSHLAAWAYDPKATGIGRPSRPRPGRPMLAIRTTSRLIHCPSRIAWGIGDVRIADRQAARD